MVITEVGDICVRKRGVGQVTTKRRRLPRPISCDGWRQEGGGAVTSVRVGWRIVVSVSYNFSQW